MSVTPAVGESSSAANLSNAKTIRADPRLSALEKKNAELMAQLAAAK